MHTRKRGVELALLMGLFERVQFLPLLEDLLHVFLLRSPELLVARFQLADPGLVDAQLFFKLVAVLGAPLDLLL